MSNNSAEATLRRLATDLLLFLASLTFRLSSGPARLGDVWAPHQQEWGAALAPSFQALAAGEPPPVLRFWIEATKGSGKDFMLAACVVWLCAFGRLPRTIQVAAADQDQADELWKSAKSLLWASPWLEQFVELKNYRIAGKSNGVEAEILSADVAGSHGARPDVLILNELSHVAKWEFIQNLADNAAKVPHNVTIVATNAGLIGHPSYQWREMAMSSPRWKFLQYSRPAPWIDADEIAEARRRNSVERFNRLWYGIWSHGTGDALSPADVEASIILPGPAPCRIHDAYVSAIDLGIKHDRSALVVLGIDCRHRRVELAECLAWNPADFGGRIPLDRVKADVLKVHQRLGLDVCLFDPWQAHLMAEQLSHAGLRTIEWPPTPVNLDLMARELIEAFRERGRIALYRDDELLSDLYRLNIVEKTTGSYRLQAQRDKSGHADRGMSLAMALPTAAAWIPQIEHARYIDSQPLEMVTT